MIKKIFGLAVIALVIGMAIPDTRARIIEVLRPVTDRVRARFVPREIEAMADQLELYYQRYGRMPSGDTRWSQWLKSGYAGDPQDPWGNQYYVVDQRRGSFTVGSAGPDGEQGTDDDLTVSR